MRFSIAISVAALLLTILLHASPGAHAVEVNEVDVEGAQEGTARGKQWRKGKRGKRKTNEVVHAHNGTLEEIGGWHVGILYARVDSDCCALICVYVCVCVCVCL